MGITQEAVRTARKVVGFKYLQGIAMNLEGLNLAEHVGVTDPSQVAIASELPNQSMAEAGKTIYRSLAAADSGWQMDSMGFITKKNRARFAVGIRDIYTGAVEYGEAGQRVSKPYLFPGAVDRVQLLADEFLPEGFDRNSQWISYHIVVESRSYQIAPVDRLYGSGAGVPKTLYFNREPDVDDKLGQRIDTDNPVSELRIKFSLVRPPDLKGSTPVVKGFRLRATLI